MRPTTSVLLLFFLIFEAGCASYPRFPSDSSTTADQLLRDFGADEVSEIIGPETLRGNTLRSEKKLFITDRRIIKRYFGTRGNNIYIQDFGFVAYGFIPIPLGDSTSHGEFCHYKFSNGIFLIPESRECDGPEKIIVTENKNNETYVCWIFGVRTDIPGWSKWDCLIEQGNTLKTDRQQP